MSAKIQSSSSSGGSGSGGATSLTAGSIVLVNSSPYTIGTTEALLEVDTSSARTINLPNPALYRKIKIKDVTGQCSTNNITLVRFAAEKIENVAASRTLQTDYGSWEVQSDGVNHWLL